MAAEDDVRGASARFYAAVEPYGGRRCRAPLEEVLGTQREGVDNASDRGQQVGWAAVQQSFEQVAELAPGGHVRLDDQFIEVGGEFAYELGIERGETTIAGGRSPSSSASRTSIVVWPGSGRWSITIPMSHWRWWGSTGRSRASGRSCSLDAMRTSLLTR